MVLVDQGNSIVYVSSVDATTVRQLFERNLYLCDIQRHDGNRDLIILNQSRITQMGLNRKLEQITKKLKKMASELKVEKQKTDKLLYQLMPSSIADALRQGKAIEANFFPSCTLLFADIVTFTNICAECTPHDVFTLLNDLYLRFDRLIELHGVYKVETIGDAYMVVGGVPDPCDNHSERVLNVSLGLLMESKLVLSPITHNPIKIRVGVHSGPVVAGIVGVKRPRYCLFGDSVNVANKMESCGVPVKIHVSESAKTNGLRTNPSFVFIDRGMTEIKAFHFFKGKGLMYTYFLERNERKSVWELCARPRSSEQTIDGYLELHDASIYEDESINTKNRRRNAKENGTESNPFTHHVRSPTCVIF
ncbi:adenylate/guanylate cyclase catalytic domain protein [Dictyocaulus viviparus]|uniref:guanylate cyclase n=1 Tax=Dictyocaulus viviparus TaxID=29172 RepID=A0A0D8XV26_DICVI|nr:adenylate/guanylate cyclase catalytic domain protein [Dictyocaulus viviparus]